MKIHEYQAKELFSQFDIPILPGRVAFNVEEALSIAGEFGLPVVIKAQVHVGGRGKAGGIKVAKTFQDVEVHSKNILSMEIKGLPVKKVLIAKAVDIREEYYLGLTLDRDARLIVFIFSTAGGIDIEEVAATSPEKITRVNIDPLFGVMDFQLKKLIYDSRVDNDKIKDILKIARKLYECYIAVDASLAEINPLAILTSGEVVALDAKLIIDDNALYRQPKLEQLREIGDDLDELEAEAQKLHLAYVHMPKDKRGSIGVMGNGAGLVMNTMDEVTRAGGMPNNFLDIGGTATPEVVEASLNHILKDEVVQGILINVFGGIVRCDIVAEGLLKAYERLPRKVPIVIRMTGTNEDLARELLEGTPLIYASSTEEGACKIVELVGRQN